LCTLILQGSVATRLRDDEVFSNIVVSSCLPSGPVKDFKRDQYVWQKYGQEFGRIFFDARRSDCVHWYVTMTYSCWIITVTRRVVVVWIEVLSLSSSLLIRETC